MRRWRLLVVVVVVVVVVGVWGGGIYLVASLVSYPGDLAGFIGAMALLVPPIKDALHRLGFKLNAFRADSVERQRRGAELRAQSLLSFSPFDLGCLLAGGTLIALGFLGPRLAAGAASAS